MSPSGLRLIFACAAAGAASAASLRRAAPVKQKAPAAQSGSIEQHVKRIGSSLVSGLGEQLDQTLVRISGQQEELREAILYCDKLVSYFGADNSTFMGSLDSADIKMGTKLLSLFDSPTVVKRLKIGLKNLTMATKHFTKLSDQRTKKFVTDIGKVHTEPERQEVLDRFYSQEGRALMVQIGKFADLLKDCLADAPEEMTTVARVASSVTTDMVNWTSVELTTRLFSGDGTDFCRIGNEVMGVHVVPAMQLAQNITQAIPGFAERHRPEVAANVTDAVVTLGTIWDTVLLMLKQHAPAVVKKVCDALDSSRQSGDSSQQSG